MLAHDDLLSANVNPATGLATDYLNRFNEAIMLYEMAIDMPDLGCELVGWAPVSYCEHFTSSGFQKRDIVIAAYRAANPVVRVPFDAACTDASRRFSEAIEMLRATRPDDPGRASALSETLEDLKRLIARLDALIHGRGPVPTLDPLSIA